MSLTNTEKLQLKTQLFTSIQALGLQDQLKKQLRMQICEKLKEKDLVKRQKLTEQTHDDKLYNRIMASIVSEELKITDCGYSNSIYIAESGFDLKILDRSQILQVLGMDQQDLDGRYSILGNMIKRKYPFHGGTLKSIGIQTNPSDIGYTLEQRLALIDQQYRKNISNNSNGINKQQMEYKNKLAALQNDLKRTYERDIERFKQFQAHNIKIKVSQEWRKKFEQYSSNISGQFNKKMQNLRKKQKLLQDNIVNKTKILDEKTVSTNKNFLQKIQLLQIKSSIAGQTQKNLQLQRKRTKQEYMKLQQELRIKKRQYQNLLLKLNDKIAYQVGVAKLAIQQEYHQKNVQFLNRKKFIDEQYGKLMGIKDTTDVIKEQSKRLYEENLRLRKDLTQLQQELRISLSENSTKADRIQVLRAQLNQHEKEKIIRDQSLRQHIKKCKSRQQQISQLRNELDQLREWRQKYQHINSNISGSVESSINNLDDLQNQQEPRHFPGMKQNKKSEIAHKLDILKQERNKQIERLRMQL